MRVLPAPSYCFNKFFMLIAVVAVFTAWFHQFVFGVWPRIIHYEICFFLILYIFMEIPEHR